MVFDETDRTPEVMARAMGKRGTYLDAHHLAVMLRRANRIGEVATAAAIAGWLAFILSVAL
jgi:hypothetical protein